MCGLFITGQVQDVAVCLASAHTLVLVTFKRQALHSRRVSLPFTVVPINITEPFKFYTFSKYV